MGDSQPLRIGFIGAGQMAGLHVRALRRVSTPHSIVGVHDVRAGAAQAFSRSAATATYDSVHELFAEARPDVVHICTSAGTHFEPARQALLAGAHVYVEKPFVETRGEADALCDAAQRAGRLICAGHQLVRDRAFGALLRRAVALGPLALLDSYLAFRPPRLDPYRASRSALADQLLDVLPHPLYTLIAALEALGSTAVGPEVVSATATPTDLYALLRVGELTGRLCVSLRARPVASTLTAIGAQGSVTADFVRSILLGAANAGVTALEKIVNPHLEAAQLTWRSAASLGARLLHGGDYPGLAELLADFYAAAAAGTPSPIGVDHLRRVTSVYEELAANVRHAAVRAIAVPAAPAVRPPAGPVVAVTGAAGFFGRHICGALADRGFRVRGIGRSDRPDDPHVHEWVRADCAETLPPDALAGAGVVVHAAAATAGGFAIHERDTIGATRQVLQAMAAAGVRRLVYVSSLSVLRPPRPLWERQTEETPRAARPERLGPYTWAKCVAEELVVGAQARGELEARIVRPAALIDWGQIELPGLVGRQLMSRWYLGFGRPGHPIAVCEVGRAGGVVAWCTDRFATAPPVINLIDPAIRTRGELLARFRERGWRGRMLWVPIGLLAAAIGVMTRLAAGLTRGRRARTPAVWSVLRPRRYDPRVAAAVLAAASEERVPERSPSRAIATERVSGTYA